MSKVYILFEVEGDGSPYIQNLVGIITNENTAKVFYNKKNCEFEEFELDDPELLNRIAKESENNK